MPLPPSQTSHALHESTLQKAQKWSHGSAICYLSFGGNDISIAASAQGAKSPKFAVHNASANLSSALSYFDDFMSKLRVVHKFLGSPSRRERFVEVVLQGKPSYNVGKSLFKSFTKTLYEERWGEVASYLSSAPWHRLYSASRHDCLLLAGTDRP